MLKKISPQQNDACVPILFDARINNLLKKNIFLDKNFAVLFINLSSSSIEFCLPEKRFDQNDILVQIEDRQALGVLQKTSSFSIAQKTAEIIKKNEGCTVGVAISPMHGTSIKKLIYNAFQAAKSSSQKGAGAWEYYNENRKDILPQKSKNTVDQIFYASLKKALENKEFFLAYQGQIHSRTGALVGVEALIRWCPEETGEPIPPGEFIPFAEKNDLIFEITDWVLQEACSQGAEWQKQGKPVRIAINVSPKCLLHENFLKNIERALDLSGLPAELLEIEITEANEIVEIESTNMVLKYLQSAGVKITLDDFGKDHSFLRHLSFLCVDKIKIDRQFICNMTSSDRVWNVVHSIINMSRRMNIECLAEGVETAEQAARLESAGCFLMQGFLWHRPGKSYPEWETFNRCEGEGS